MPHYEKFGHMLARLRVQAGFEKQRDLGAALGFAQQSISRWEAGTSRPRSGEMPRLVRALKLKDATALYRAAGYLPKVRAQPAAIAAVASSPALSPDRLEKLWFDHHGSVRSDAGVELNERGEFVLRSTVRGHDALCADIVVQLTQRLGPGARLGLPVMTQFGVRIPSVVWMSETRREGLDSAHPVRVAPELCIDVVDSFCVAELRERRVDGYLRAGAQEVILVDVSGDISHWTGKGRVSESPLGVSLTGTLWTLALSSREVRLN